jgi:hypothetical protein
VVTNGLSHTVRRPRSRLSARPGPCSRHAARGFTLVRAADAYDRAARVPYGRIPRCTYAGDQLRLLARRLADLGLTADGGHAGDLALSLAMLTTVVADLRAAQHHAVQAAAARRAAEHHRGAVTYHRSDLRPTEPRMRASDVA